MAAAGVQRSRSQCQNVVGKPKLDKYVLIFEQICLAIWTNTLTVRQLGCSVRGQNVRMLLARWDFADLLQCMIWQMKFANVLIFRELRVFTLKIHMMKNISGIYDFMSAISSKL